MTILTFKRGSDARAKLIYNSPDGFVLQYGDILVCTYEDEKDTEHHVWNGTNWITLAVTKNAGWYIIHIPVEISQHIQDPAAFWLEGVRLPCGGQVKLRIHLVNRIHSRSAAIDPEIDDLRAEITFTSTEQRGNMSHLKCYHVLIEERTRGDTDYEIRNSYNISRAHIDLNPNMEAVD